MLSDFTIGKCTRKCAVTSQPLARGESFFSAIIGQGPNVYRQDISAAAWSGPPPGTVAWWRQKMPIAATKRLQPAPTGVLLDTLTELIERPGSEPLAYLLALLLTRRRVLLDDETTDIADHLDSSRWQLNYPADGRQWSVPVAVPSPDVLEGLQVELNSLLFTEV